MSLSKVGRTGEVALIIAAGGLAAWYSPELDLPALLCVAFLAKFRGRAQALTAAVSTSVMVLAFTFVTPHVALPVVALIVKIAALCLGAVILSDRKPEAEGRPQVHLDKLSKFVWSLRADGTMEYGSPAFCEYAGCPLIEMQDFRSLIHPDDLGTCEDAMSRAAGTGEPQQFQARYRSALGEYLWFITMLHSQLDSSNNVVRYLGLQWNIDQHKRKEQEMGTRENIWETVLKMFPGWMWVARPDGTPEFASAAALAYSGLTSEEAMTNPNALVHPDDKQLRRDYWKERIEKGTPGEIEMRIRGADGKYRWFASRSYPIRNTAGELERWVMVNWDIDDRKNAEYKDWDQQTQLNLLGERFPGFLWKALPDGKVTYINRYCEDYLGLAADQAAADWGRLIHPDDRDEVMRRWAVVAGGGQWHDHVHRLAGKDGEYRWFQSRITAIKDESGAVVALHGLMMDAHEMVSAERTVRQEEKQLRNLVDAMPAMIWRSDRHGRIDRWNRTMIETIGKSWEASETFELMSKIDPVQRPQVEERWAKSVRLGVPYEDTYRILANDGKYHWHLVRAQPFRDDNGNILSWYGVHTDIDALKTAEHSLQMREHELLQIIDTVPSMLWAASPTGEAMHVSRRLREYSGWPLEKFSNLGWEKFLHPDDFEEAAKAFFRSIQTGESFNSVHRLRRADGEYRWHHVRGEPLRDPDGKIIQWYGLSIDIDERKKAEDHLRETRAKLNTASRVAMVAELSASIAHQLNQPLMSVLGNAQASRRWLAATPPNLEEAVVSIDRIVRDAKAADQSMQNIRALFKQERLEKTEVSLPNIIGEALRLVQEDPGKRGVTVNCSFADDVPLVFADPILMQEVFVNLISNAIEAMENSLPAPPIIISVKAVENEVVIQVIDRGPGVRDPENIFDAFVTTKEKGMGVGLAVSRSIVAAHQGELWAENNSGSGAAFTLTLPLDKAATHSREISEETSVN